MKVPYQFTARASKGNAFCWMTGEPSIFATPAARKYAASVLSGQEKGQKVAAARPRTEPKVRARKAVLRDNAIGGPL